MTKPQEIQRRQFAERQAKYWRQRCADCPFWRPIATLDRSEMKFLLVTQDSAIRCHLWNPRGFWEYPDPLTQQVPPTSTCGQPTHWMPLPELPYRGR